MSKLTYEIVEPPPELEEEGEVPDQGPLAAGGLPALVRNRGFER